MRPIKSVITVLLIAAVCLLSLPAAAQQPGPQSKEGTVSDNDFLKLQQQIKQLKNATFRAFLRVQLLSWDSLEHGPTRRQAAIEVATQGVTDLCEHRDEVWTPTASWLHELFVEKLKTLRSPEDTPLEICVFSTETKNSSGKDFPSAIKMLNNPETSAEGLSLVKSAILNGQVSSGAMLGHLLSLDAAKSPHVVELLGALLDLEERQPGTLTLRLLPFFTSLFRGKTVPSEILTRYIVIAVRATRLSAQEFADPTVPSSVSQLLSGIIIPAKQLTPDLYPEIAARLIYVNRKDPNSIEAMLAAEERIQNASDQVAQLISEADSASDTRKKQYFFRAAKLAKEQSQLSKATDLITKAADERELNNIDSRSSMMNDFLSEVVSLALKKKSPEEATNAVSKMTKPLVKARAFRLLGEYYGANKDKIKSREAFTQSGKQLKSVVVSNEKVRSSLLLAESVLKYEPDDAYAIFREAVKDINNLPSPEKDQEKMYYVQLLPVARDLIRSFRLLAAREQQTATSLVAEIKLSELRLSALSGVYSGH